MFYTNAIWHKKNDILSEVVVNIRESWEAETTINNLNIIKNRRIKNGNNMSWIDKIIRQLN